MVPAADAAVRAGRPYKRLAAVTRLSGAGGSAGGQLPTSGDERGGRGTTASDDVRRGGRGSGANKVSAGQPSRIVCVLPTASGQTAAGGVLLCWTFKSYQPHSAAVTCLPSSPPLHIKSSHVRSALTVPLFSAMDVSLPAPCGRALVVGGGVFGLSTACALRRRYLTHAANDASSRPSHCYGEVVLLEASNEATGSPLAASVDLNRIVRADYGDDALYTELALRAITGWHDFNARHGEAVYNECGVLLLTERELEAERYEHSSFVEMRRRGLPVKRLRAADGGLAAHFPLHAASGQYVDGYLNRRGGFVDNGRATQLLSEEAVRLGVDIRRGVRAVQLQRDDGDSGDPVSASATASVLTSAGVMRADCIVICCGAWTPSLVPYTAALLHPSAQPVVYLSPPSSLSAALSAESFPVCAAALSGSGYYFFPLSARPLLDPARGCGGCVVKAAHHGPGLVGLTDPSAPRHCPPAVSARLVRHMQAAMPVLRQCELVADRLCFYCDTHDGDWLIDTHNHFSNVAVAAGDRSGDQHRLAWQRAAQRRCFRLHFRCVLSLRLRVRVRVCGCVV